MNQSQTFDLQVKVCLDLGEAEPTIKRVPTAQSFAELVEACKQILDKAGIARQSNMKVFYRDSDGDKLAVTDDCELQMAYATALSCDCKVKFHIDLPGFVPKPAPVQAPI